VASFDNCFFNVGGKFLLINYVIVKVFFQVFCAFTPAVTIEYTENLNVGPIFGFRNLIYWIYYIQYYGNSVFVVISNQTSVGVSGKSLHDIKFFV
jgi:hypothetical protein